ncbi:MAG: aromatic aminobenezylarsenical efflux permease ArsG family transporter [Candidatus Micrarchaeota archaeon]|nr:aromatic aminobenezylarsenical efflux permease ArsG family transporter [Candidatus Micrarchaeota archaeon]
MEAMGTSEFAPVAAFFIGLMMALSPCPLATNITAIAYISRNHGKGRREVLLTGFAYTLGRMLAYVALASFIVFAGLNVQLISGTLQAYGEKILGPFLIVVGILLLDVFRLPSPQGGKTLESIKEKLARSGLLGSFLLGVVFALAFCPFSAVLFFGMLVPLAMAAGDGLLIPAIFAFATGLPVILFSFILAYSLSRLGGMMNAAHTLEKYMRVAVSIVFIIVGLYYTVSVTLGLA